jgi:predicted O-methyltransferase YrrM
MTIDDYIIEHSDIEDKILVVLTRETHLTEVAPRMLSGYLQGKFIEFLSKMIRPKSILEIGTFTGYSAICLAKGLAKNGTLYTIEINDEREKLIKKYIDKSGFSSLIKLYIGNAIEIIPNINENFDLVFIDGEKSEYLNYYNCVFDKVNSEGFIVADNVLWNNKVVDPLESEDPSTKAIKDFNIFVSRDKRVEKLILPVRDGLMLIRKK